jgi:hypothetical protein
MGNNRAYWAVRKALLSMEQSLKLKAKGSYETQVKFGVISLEVQKQHLAHQGKCGLCLRSEAA